MLRKVKTYYGQGIGYRFDDYIYLDSLHLLILESVDSLRIEFDLRFRANQISLSRGFHRYAVDHYS